MEIIKRKLTSDEAKIIYDGIRETPNITGHTIEELQSYKNTYIAIEGNKLVGVGVWIEVSKKWDELLILFVVEKYRNQGIGKKLFEKIVSEMNDRSIFSSSRNPIVIKLLKDINFKIVKFGELPRDIKMYYLHYSLSLYRISEYLRKNFLKSNKPFVYGLLKRD